MISLFKAALPIFGGPKNYAEMLLKLAGFTFWVCFILMYQLQKKSDARELLSRYFPEIIPISIIPDGMTVVHFQIFLISLFVAFIFHFLQMHNIIQKLFGFRSRFDTNHIFKPLAEKLGFTVTTEMKNKFKSNRNEIMQEIFYDFSSSTKETTTVDKHNIHQALWLWSLFWACEEAIFLILIFSLLFGYFNDFGMVKALLVIAALLMLAMWQIWPRVSGNAKAQVHQIAVDTDAATAAKKAINAL
jgi:hypothetical protein